jgi:ATP-dependent helicase HrpA
VIEVALPLIKRRVYDPFWSAKAGCCKAYLQQSIFGLILCTKKLINYEQEDRDFCRDLFLREGIIQRQLKTKIPEIKLFWNACDEIAQQEDKIRKRDRLLDTHSLVQLLDRKIPAEIVSIGQFHKWYDKANINQRKQLLITTNELLKQDVGEMPKLPEFWQINDVQLPISYLFEPGAEDDGMTVQLPLALLPGLDSADFEYLIPSLLREKIIALLKGLPKKLRKNFVPVPDYSDALLQRMQQANNKEKLHTAICRHLKQITDVNLSIEDLEKVELPEQLRVNFNVIDENGITLVKGRDLNFLQQHAESRNWQATSIKPDDADKIEMQVEFDSWPENFQDEAIEVNHSGIKIRQYPSLTVQNNKVIKTLFSSPVEAKYHTNEASLALLMKNLKNQIDYAKKHIEQKQKITLGYSSLGSFEDFFKDICWSCISTLKADKTIQSSQQFSELVEIIAADLVPMILKQSSNMAKILEQFVTIKKSLKGKLSVAAISSYNNISALLDDLIYPGFIKQEGLNHLANYQRYLKSLLLRLEKLPHNANRERADIEIINSWKDKIVLLEVKINIWSEEFCQLQQLRLMLDELSVSLFTQELKTVIPVSEKRLRKQYNSLLNVLG